MVRTSGNPDSRKKYFPKRGFFSGDFNDEDKFDALVESDDKHVYISTQDGKTYKVPRKQVKEK